MPFIKVETNVRVRDVAGSTKRLSELAAELLDKPEIYVLAVLEPEKSLIFGGTPDPAAYVTLDSIRLPEDRIPKFSAAVCAFLEKEYSIPGNRVYIAFSDIMPHRFGWDGRTF
ncbi:phenylpyruvate tautomerase MIF-related protein [Pseudodesulfovibrio sp. S3]|uniref:phenylpyruvate tautomerase MIF-related protein n=1 Tax=unclassified Pseudodesulfovibrio TaxID=2661612 RepID=UPI000FEBF7E8|nr:phenylpyruvate tautomerase MIF-related protein [Pseudodesulfovibrio sp. S3]MCJ2164959.1 phenylpyruvate tautomerase MIF-related protein [Pseudodesulfovibrio sp. S3-i]RWU03596.1 hypothetical protein DWB63_10975 [Pseudodesulfovibrio sp. S3]